MKNLQTFGELCVMLDIHHPIKAKDTNRGLFAIYFGRERYHSDGTHRFKNINTKRLSMLIAQSKRNNQTETEKTFGKTEL
jgi:hypothetical protein